MINKMANGVSTILLFICSHEVWVKVIGPRPCANACANVNPVFTCQSYDITISTSTKNDLVRFSCAYALLMTTQFSLAYTYVIMLMSTSFHLLTHVLMLILMR